jgi:asparagine synthase (glutamine-hydrolysing)
MLPPRFKLFLKRRSGQPLYPGFADPDFARAERLPLRVRSVPRYPRGASFAQREFYRTFVSGWRVHALETNDLMAARFGIEERHPFNDRRLIEFLFAIPEDVRLRNGRRKFVLREAMRDVIPEKIRNRRDKADFSVVFWESLGRMNPHRLFDRMELKRCGWLDDVEFRGAYSEFMANYADENINVWTLWTAFALELWYRLVILGQDVTEIVEAANAKVQQSLAN